MRQVVTAPPKTSFFGVALCRKIGPLQQASPCFRIILIALSSLSSLPGEIRSLPSSTLPLQKTSRRIISDLNIIYTFIESYHPVLIPSLFLAPQAFLLMCACHITRSFHFSPQFDAEIRCLVFQKAPFIRNLSSNRATRYSSSAKRLHTPITALT